MNRLARWILHHAGWVALIGTLSAGGAGVFCVKLYQNLKTDFEELLPTHARSVLDLEKVTTRLESIDSLGIVVTSQDTDASRRFVDDLSAALSELPKDMVARVEHRIDREIEFFKKRKALFVDVPDLERIRNYIHDRIEYEKQLYNPLTIFTGGSIQEPKLDFEALIRRYEGRVSQYESFPEGYYATPDEKVRIILAYMSGKSSGISESLRLKKAVDETVARVNPRTYAPDLHVAYTGSIQNLIEEHGALIADLVFSTVVVVALVTLAMWVFFRSIAATAALVVSLFCGTLWTFGVSYFTVGYLNANSAFLGSIVIGNGINFGIIFLARYLEERRRRHGMARAILTAMRTTSHSTWTAAIAAGASYGSLMLTSFRGFSQFGLIGFTGMVLCWISAFTLLPAYLVLLDKTPFRPRLKRPPKSILARGLARGISRFPNWIRAGVIVATAGSFLLLPQLDSKIIENDLSKLRSQTSIESGSVYWSKYQDQIFKADLSPVVALPQTRKEAREIASLLRKTQREEGETSLIATVQTLDDFIPRDQERKIAILKEIQSLLTPQVVNALSSEEKKRIRKFFTPETYVPFEESHLPDLILSRFREKQGEIGRMVLTGKPIANNETWDAGNLITFVRKVREAADQVAPGTPVAGQIPVTADMFESILRDGPKATLSALGAVALIVVFLFGNPRSIFLVLTALGLGFLWMAGTVLGMGWKINFLNFIALPITFGIGVDYAVNVFMRHRIEKGRDILRVIENTGGAVMLASLTTIIGYGSLLIADNRAFVSFGALAVLGEITCLIAAVVALPAFLYQRAPEPQTQPSEAQ